LGGCRRATRDTGIGTPERELAIGLEYWAARRGHRRAEAFRRAIRWRVGIPDDDPPAAFGGNRCGIPVEIRPSARDVLHHAVACVREPGDEWLWGKPLGEHFPVEQETKADILAV
jgi:hypothetical protein